MTLIVMVLVFGTSLCAFARGDSGHFGSFAIGGFYGLASVSPSDVNGLANAVGSSPPLGGVNSDLYYGGLLEFTTSQHIDLKFEYDFHDAKDLTTTNLNSNTGFEIQENDVWGILDFYLVRNSSVYAYLGAGVGYPTAVTMNKTTSSLTQYTAARNLGYVGEGGIGVMLGGHLSLFFEGGYQYLISGNITQNSSGAILTNTAGQNAVINMSGPRANAGLKLHF